MSDTYTPGNSPLLCADDTSPFAGLSKLRHVYWNLSAADSNRDTIDESSDHQLRDAVRAAYDNATDAPNNSTNLNCSLSAQPVGQDTRSKSTNEGAARHRSGDATLDGRGWTCTLSFSVESPLVEEAFVLLRAQAGRMSVVTFLVAATKKTHMADIEAMSNPNSCRR